MLRRLFPILLLSFVNVIGFSLLIPVLVHVAHDFSATAQIGTLMYGVVVSSYALFQFVGAPILGALSDRWGRRPLLLVSQLGTLLSWVLFASSYFVPVIWLGPIALPLLVILISRITDGLTGGNISVAQAWIADSTSDEDKTKAFGLNGAVFGLGFLIGPALGGLSAATSWGYLGTAILAIIISTFTLIILWWLPESLPVNRRKRHPVSDWIHEVNVFEKINRLPNRKRLSPLLIQRLIFFASFSGYTTLIVLLLERSFGLTSAGLGAVISLVGLYSIINQIFVTPRFAARFGALESFRLSLLIIGLGLLVLPLLPTQPMFGLPLHWMLLIPHILFLNIGINVGNPTFKSFLVQNVDRSQLGLVTGIDESLVALANAVVPVIASILFSFLGGNAFLMFALVALSAVLYGRKISPESIRQAFAST